MVRSEGSGGMGEEVRWKEVRSRASSSEPSTWFPIHPPSPIDSLPVAGCKVDVGHGSNTTTGRKPGERKVHEDVPPKTQRTEGNAAPKGGTKGMQEGERERGGVEEDRIPAVLVRDVWQS
eukprot:scaffold431_cov334-Pavlova_lutheri.AAC.36